MLVFKSHHWYFTPFELFVASTALWQRTMSTFQCSLAPFAISARRRWKTRQLYVGAHYRFPHILPNCIIYYLVNGRRSLSWSETFWPDWKADASGADLRRGHHADGHAKWHLPVTGKWWGLARANELRDECMFKPHLKWRLWHCHTSFRENSICQHQLSKVWLDFWRDQFVSKCVQSGLFVIMIRYLYLFCGFGRILNSISAQISLSYRVFEGRLGHNTVHHFERQG